MNIIEESKKVQSTESASSVDDIVRLLDSYPQSGVSRLKLNVVEGEGQVISKEYHHGRCDVGSPWAKGQAVDVLE